MAWIDTVAESDADGELAELYGSMCDSVSGRLDNILKVHSLEPRSLNAHWILYRSAMRPSRGLRKADLEMIALVVSAANRCEY